MCDGSNQNLCFALHKSSPLQSSGHPLDTFFYVFLFLNNMVGTGNTSTTESNEIQIAKLDSRFHAMLTTLGCHTDTLARLGELGVHSFRALHTIGDDRKDVREFCKNDLGLDRAEGTPHTLEQGKLVSAWEQSATKIDVETKRDAERQSANLPPQLTDEDLTLLRTAFEKHHNRGREISDDQCPSKPYLELEVRHMENLWAAAKLTEVTSYACALRHREKNAHTKNMELDEVTCSFKVVTKPFGVPSPDDSESLRARIRLVRNTFLMLKLKDPAKGVSGAQKRKLGPVDEGEIKTLTRSQRKAKAKAKAKAQQQQQLALQNNNGGGRGSGGGGGNGGGRGAKAKRQLAILDADQQKGAGKGGKQQLNRVTPDNKAICYAWNNGQACKSTPCNFEHVCQICFDKSHTKENCPQKA